MEIKESSKRLTIITGSIGSGKSEYAINLALSEAREGIKNIALLDLDWENTFLGSREAVGWLEQNHIEALVPPREVLYSDLPATAPEIGEAIRNPLTRLIIDAGGDDTGAAALGIYREEIQRREHDILMLVNPYRPFTRCVKNIARIKADIENSSGLSITAIISNPNTGAGTGIDKIKAGHQVVQEAAKHLNLPLTELVVLDEVLRKHENELLEFNIPLRPLNIKVPSKGV